MIEVRKSKYGRGVFAKDFIPKDTIVEISNVIILPKDESKFIDKTLLTMYSFGIGEGFECICLGLGSLFNHSGDNNLITKRYFEKQVIEFITTKDVLKDEELFINYGYDIEKHREHYFKCKSE